MEKFDIKSIKFLGAVVIVCLIFVLSISLVNKNLKQDNANGTTAVVQTNQESEVNEKTAVEEESNAEEKKDERETSEGNDVNDDIQEDDEAVTEELTEQAVYLKAEELRAEQKYESAVYEYQQLIKNTEKASVQAQCNEEIAKTYASMKRYGTALAYAQKAYITEPTDERELLLARIYYKTGNTSKATEHINSILQRDFVELK